MTRDMQLTVLSYATKEIIHQIAETTADNKAYRARTGEDCTVLQIKLSRLNAELAAINEEFERLDSQSTR